MRKKICFVVSSPLTVNSFLLEYVRALKRCHDVFVVANFPSQEKTAMLPPDIKSVHVPIERRISILADLKALFALYSYFRNERFDVIHSVTPKAGLLSMISAWWVKAPLRFHTFTGQVWATRSGWIRWLLKSMDRVIFHCATDVLVDSPSQRDFLLKEGIVDDRRSFVLADGSISGVDIQRFQPDPEARIYIRNELGVPHKAFVFLYLGRLNREKGIVELAEAFSRLSSEHEDAYLIIVGPDEESMMDRIRNVGNFSHDHVIYRGFTNTPEKYMAAADVFCLPSHREGFGSVIIEAAAAGIPSIGSNIYGISDAIVQGETGLLHESQNSAELYNCMKELISDKSKTLSLGRVALKRARARYSKAHLVDAFLAFYEEKLANI